MAWGFSAFKNPTGRVEHFLPGLLRILAMIFLG
jgi:hypothetical protein